MTRRAGLIIGLVILLIAAGGIVGWRWWHNRPPYGPQVLGATATLRLVDQATADAAFGPITMEHASDNDQIFLGQVAWTPPPNPQPGGSLRIVVLDKRTRLMPGYINVTAARPHAAVPGSDASLDLAEKRHPWLQGIGAHKVNGGFSNPGCAVTATIDASPVTIAIVLHPPRPGTRPEQAVATAPAAVSDLTVALLNVGPDYQAYWAQRLLN
jgi:hypothetical protein